MKREISRSMTKVESRNDDRYVFNFSVMGATLERDGDNLAMKFEDGHELVFENFYKMKRASFVMENQEVETKDFFAALGAEKIAPALGPAQTSPSESGNDHSSHHSWESMSALEGIWHLNGLDINNDLNREPFAELPPNLGVEAPGPVVTVPKAEVLETVADPHDPGTMNIESRGNTIAVDEGGLAKGTGLHNAHGISGRGFVAIEINNESAVVDITGNGGEALSINLPMLGAVGMEIKIPAPEAGRHFQINGVDIVFTKAVCDGNGRWSLEYAYALSGNIGHGKNDTDQIIASEDTGQRITITVTDMTGDKSEPVYITAEVHDDIPITLQNGVPDNPEPAAEVSHANLSGHFIVNFGADGPAGVPFADASGKPFALVSEGVWAAKDGNGTLTITDEGGGHFAYFYEPSGSGDFRRDISFMALDSDNDTAPVSLSVSRTSYVPTVETGKTTPDVPGGDLPGAESIASTGSTIVVDEGALPDGAGGHRAHGKSGAGVVDIDIHGESATIYASAQGAGASGEGLALDLPAGAAKGTTVSINVPAAGYHCQINGVDVIFTQAVAQGNGHWVLRYSYSLPDNIAHDKETADQIVASAQTGQRIVINAVDQTGDYAAKPAYITAEVHDDVPVTTLDGVREDFVSGHFSVAFGADGRADIPFSDLLGRPFTQEGPNSWSMPATDGKLIVSKLADGTFSYVYEPDIPGKSFDESFSFVAVDGDGDTTLVTVSTIRSTEPSIEIGKTTPDGGATAPADSGATIHVDEGALPSGTKLLETSAHGISGKGSVLVELHGESGVVTVDAVSGASGSPLVISLKAASEASGFDISSSSAHFQLGGVDVTFTRAEYLGEGKWSLNYDYALASAQDHGAPGSASDVIVNSGQKLAVTVLDQTGDPDPEGAKYITAEVHDDIPVVSSAPASMPGNIPAHAEVSYRDFSGTFRVNFGADGEAAPENLFKAEDGSYAFYDAGAETWTIADSLGSFVISRDGDGFKYEFTPKTDVSGKLVEIKNHEINFKALDHDLDEASLTATLNQEDWKPQVTVNDTEMGRGGHTIHADESAMPGGTGKEPESAHGATGTGFVTVELHGESGTATLTGSNGGSLAIDLPAAHEAATFAITSITPQFSINGVDVSFTQAEYIGGGVWHLNYDYSLSIAQEHGAPGSTTDKIVDHGQHINVVVKDQTGDETAPARITAEVHDDVPVVSQEAIPDAAKPDQAGVTYENFTGTFAVDFGADGEAEPGNLFKGPDGAFAAYDASAGTWTIETAKGSFVIERDGSGFKYTFSPKAGESVVDYEIGFSALDHDFDAVALSATVGKEEWKPSVTIEDSSAAQPGGATIHADEGAMPEGSGQASTSAHGCTGTGFVTVELHGESGTVSLSGDAGGSGSMSIFLPAAREAASFDIAHDAPQFRINGIDVTFNQAEYLGNGKWHLNYSYTLAQAREHGDPGSMTDLVINEGQRIAVSILDQSGDPDPEGVKYITAEVHDDVPVVAANPAADPANIPAHAEVSYRNFTGTFTVDFGADGEAAPENLFKAEDGSFAVYDAAGTWTIADPLGSFVITRNGGNGQFRYAFTPAKDASGNEVDVVSHSISFTALDHDLDEAGMISATVHKEEWKPSISVEKTHGEPGDAIIHADEGAMPEGNRQGDSIAHGYTGTGFVAVELHGESGTVTMSGSNGETLTIDLPAAHEAASFDIASSAPHFRINGVDVTVTDAEYLGSGQWHLNYTYTLAQAQTHGGAGSTTDDIINGGQRISVVVKDQSGDETSPEYITAEIHDDIPVMKQGDVAKIYTDAANDTAESSLSGTFVVSFGADDMNAKPFEIEGQRPDANPDGTYSFGLSNGGAVVISHVSGNQWKYGYSSADTAAGNSTLPEIPFTLTAYDKDGDKASVDLSVLQDFNPEITGTKDPLTGEIVVGKITVDEALMAKGVASHADGHVASGDGSFVVKLHGESGHIDLSAAGASPISIEISDDDTLAKEWTAPAGMKITAKGVELTITGATLDADGWHVNYHYSLEEAQTHSKNNVWGKDDAVSGAIAVEVWDSDSTVPAVGRLDITVHDDAPVMKWLDALGAEVADPFVEVKGGIAGFPIDLNFGADNGADRKITLQVSRTVGSNNPETLDPVEGAFNEESGVWEFSVTFNGVNYMNAILNPDTGEFRCNNVSNPDVKEYTTYDFKLVATDADGDTAEASMSSYIRASTLVNPYIENTTVVEEGVAGHNNEAQHDAKVYGVGVFRDWVYDDKGNKIPAKLENDNLVDGWIVGDDITVNGFAYSYEIDDCSAQRGVANEYYEQMKVNNGKIASEMFPGGIYLAKDTKLYVAKNDDGSISIVTSEPSVERLYGYLNVEGYDSVNKYGKPIFNIDGEKTTSTLWQFYPSENSKSAFQNMVEGEQITLDFYIQNSAGTSDILHLKIVGTNDTPDSKPATTADDIEYNKQFEFFNDSHVINGKHTDSYGQVTAAQGAGWETAVNDKDETVNVVQTFAPERLVIDNWDKTAFDAIFKDSEDPQKDVANLLKTANKENSVGQGRVAVRGYLQINDPDLDGPRRIDGAEREIETSEVIKNGQYQLGLYEASSTNFQAKDSLFWQTNEQFNEFWQEQWNRPEHGFAVEIANGKDTATDDVLRGYGGADTVYEKQAVDIADGKYICIEGIYGSFFVNAYAEFYYVSGYTDIQSNNILALGSNEIRRDIFNFRVVDAHESKGQMAWCAFYVTGVNDAPVIDEVQNTSVSWRGGMAEGAIVAHDPDTPDNLGYYFVNDSGNLVEHVITAYGVARIDTKTGEYTYEVLNRQAAQTAVNAGNVTEKFYVAAVDGLGALDVRQVEIVVNDDPAETVSRDIPEDHIEKDLENWNGTAFNVGVINDPYANGQTEAENTYSGRIKWTGHEDYTYQLADITGKPLTSVSFEKGAFVLTITQDGIYSIISNGKLGETNNEGEKYSAYLNIYDADGNAVKEHVIINFSIKGVNDLPYLSWNEDAMNIDLNANDKSVWGQINVNDIDGYKTSTASSGKLNDIIGWRVWEYNRGTNNDGTEKGWRDWEGSPVWKDVAEEGEHQFDGKYGRLTIRSDGSFFYTVDRTKLIPENTASVDEVFKIDVEIGQRSFISEPCYLTFHLMNTVNHPPKLILVQNDDGLSGAITISDDDNDDRVWLWGRGFDGAATLHANGVISYAYVVPGANFNAEALVNRFGVHEQRSTTADKPEEGRKIGELLLFHQHNDEGEDSSISYTYQFIPDSDAQAMGYDSIDFEFAGSDKIGNSSEHTKVTVDLKGFYESLQRMPEGETEISGTNADDNLAGSVDDDEISGGAGKDIIQGMDGNDVLHGGDDNDILIGGKGDDVLHGDAGEDILIGGEGNDIIFFDSGDKLIDGGSGTDFMIADEIGAPSLYKMLENTTSLPIARNIESLLSATNSSGLEALRGVKNLSDLADLGVSVDDEGNVLLSGWHQAGSDSGGVIFYENGAGIRLETTANVIQGKARSFSLEPPLDEAPENGLEEALGAVPEKTEPVPTIESSSPVSEDPSLFTEMANVEHSHG